MKRETIKDMDEGAFRLAYLIAGYIRGILTESEHDELDNWVEANDHNMLLFEELTDEKNIEANLEWMDKTMSERNPELTKKNIEFNPEYSKLKIQRWFYSVAASVILLIAAFGVYKIINHKEPNKTPVAKIDQNEIQTGRNKATLTLSDGSVIDLTDMPNGSVKRDDRTFIRKPKEGEIVYDDGGQNSISVSNNNILTTPKGGQYQVQLPDGSAVWLNASSSLKYPTTFASSNRTVELKGEGYFEIAKDKSKPFIVRLSDGSAVKVFGTHFNIMAYENESTDVTLLEGSVEITNGKSVQKLTPGQQGKITSSKIILTNSVDTDQVIAWKNGEFIFRDADIQSVMKQVARWYGVDVKFETLKTEHFNATISRGEPVAKVLHVLEETGEVHFKIKNKVVYVLP